jgi:hypothetical protein
MEAVTVYTALYDLDREKVDSRTFATYVDWLKATIELFPGIVVFHDGQLDSFDLQNCVLIRKHLVDLHTFKFITEVNTVLKTFKPNAPGDITFRLPSYGLLQYAKFEFASLLVEPAPSVMWVDAGISRFVKQINCSQLDKSISKLQQNDIDALFEIDIRNNFEFINFALADYSIGSCRRVISGGSFWVSAAFVDELHNAVCTEMQRWLKHGKWDNEQVMLRKILPKLKGKFLFVPQLTGVPGCVPRTLASKRPKIYRNLTSVVTFLLRRGSAIGFSRLDATTQAE